MAPWDPEARELGVPLRLLFGDLSRSRVKLYAGGWWRGRWRRRNVRLWWIIGHFGHPLARNIY